MKKALQTVAELFYAEKDRWFALLPVLFGLGIGLYFSLPVEPSLFATLAIIEIMLISAYVWRHFPTRLMILGAVGIVVLGFANIQLKAVFLTPPQNITYSDEEIYIQGKIINIDRNYNGKTRILLTDATDFEDNQIDGNYRITLNKNRNKLKIGECVEVASSIFPLARPNIYGGYQFDRKAYFEGINALGYSMADAYPKECKTPESSISVALKSLIFEMRQKIIARINSALPNAEEASIADALIAGEQNLISKKQIGNYRDSGLAHFLSISGLHMGMLAFIMFFFIRFFVALIPPIALRYNSKKIAAVCAIIISFAYLLISGAQIPAQRAFIMTLVVLIGVLFDREAISIRTISFAAFVVLLLAPQALISASFQMSFAAVLAMIAFYEKFAPSISRFFSGGGIIRYIVAYLCGIVISDLVASFATLPFAIYHFNRIAIYTSLGNFLAGPVIGLVVMPCVLLSLLALPFGLEALPLKALGFGLSLINRITAYVSSLPEAGYQVTAMPFWGFLLICIGGLWLCIWRKNWRYFGFIGIIIGFFSITLVKTPDMMTDAKAEVFALKDNFGELIILPSRGNNFTKNIWLERSGQDKLEAEKKNLLKQIVDGKTTDKTWLDLECYEYGCVYKNRITIGKDGAVMIDGKFFDVTDTLGASVYLYDKPEIKTIREYIGNRLWNK